MKLSKVQAALGRAGLGGVVAREERKSLVLEGRVQTWAQFIAAGYTAVGHGYKGIVNNIRVAGIEPEPPLMPLASQSADLQGTEVDVLIIGGGVIGCAVARELTRWQLQVALVDKEEDVAKHTSSRNNGMIHPGIAVKAGTKKHYYNIRGNKMYAQAAVELGFDLTWPGSLYFFERAWHRALYPFARLNAAYKGVEDMRFASRRQVFALEPNAWPNQQGGLLVPATGIVAPYQVTVAYAENAVENGALVWLNTGVTGFDLEAGKITGVCTNRGTIRAKLVINAAGVWADKIAALADDRFFSIHARKGVLAIMDKSTGPTQTRVFGVPQLGKSYTKGGGLTPLVEGNILMGPTAVEVPHREDYATDSQDMQFMFERHLRLNRALRPGQIITYFAGTRACTFEEDFIIEPSEQVANLVHVAGIQSPGLASAPAIAQDVAGMAVKILSQSKAVRPNPDFNPRRQASPRLSGLSLEERGRLIAQNPGYGRIVCRCEAVSEAEIAKAIHSPLPALSLDAIKRRTRVGMGRCQGGFCTPALLEIVARESGRDVTEICKAEPGSELIITKTKTLGRGKKHED